jgi:transposase
MKSYSVDFRQKIIDVYHNEPLSQKAIAERFCVALSFVQKLIKQYRLTQNIAPQTYRCGGQLKLNPEQLVVLAELIEANNDATLEELRYLLYQKIGVAISRATMGRMTKLLNMTLKKNTLPERERH